MKANKLKRALALVTSFAVTSLCTALPLAAGAAATSADDLTFSIGTVAGEPGDAVSVDVLLENNPGINTVKLVFDIPEGISYAGIDDDGITLASSFANEMMLFAANTDKNSLVAGSAQDFSLEGVFCTLNLVIDEDAVSGTTYEIGISSVELFDDAESASIPVNLSSGSVDVYDGLTIYASHATGMVGEEVTIDLSIFDNPGFYASKFILSFDTSLLEFVDYTEGSVLGNSAVYNYSDISDRFLIAAAAVDGFNEDGLLASVTLRIIGGEGVIPVNVEAEYIYDSDGSQFSSANDNGSVTVIDPDVAIVSAGHYEVEEVGVIQTVEVFIENNSGFSAAQFEISFDETLLEYVDDSISINGFLLDGFTGVQNYNGRVIVNVAALDVLGLDGITDDGILFTFDVVVLADNGGEPIPLVVNVTELKNSAGSDLPHELSNGSITVLAEETTTTTEETTTTTPEETTTTTPETTTTTPETTTTTPETTTTTPETTTTTPETTTTTPETTTARVVVAIEAEVDDLGMYFADDQSAFDVNNLTVNAIINYVDEEYAVVSEEIIDITADCVLAQLTPYEVYWEAYSSGEPTFWFDIEVLYGGDDADIVAYYDSEDYAPAYASAIVGQRGDANMDHIANTSDAALVLVYDFELSWSNSYEFNSENNHIAMFLADVDETGIIDTTDAAYILVYDFEASWDERTLQDKSDIWEKVIS